MEEYYEYFSQSSLLKLLMSTKVRVLLFCFAHLPYFVCPVIFPVLIKLKAKFLQHSKNLNLDEGQLYLAFDFSYHMFYILYTLNYNETGIFM